MKTLGTAQRGVWLAVAATLLVAIAPARGEDFSFYGAGFGATRPKLEAIWLPLDGGKFALPTPAVRQVDPSFDHEGRMYRISFTVELPEDQPARLAGLAFQNLVESKWGRGNPELGVSLEVGPRSATVAVTDKRLLEAYLKHIEAKLAPLLQP